MPAKAHVQWKSCIPHNCSYLSSQLCKQLTQALREPVPAPPEHKMGFRWVHWYLTTTLEAKGRQGIQFLNTSAEVNELVKKKKAVP